MNVKLEIFVWEMTNYSVVIQHKIKDKNEDKIRNIICLGNKILVEYEMSIQLIDILNEDISYVEMVIDCKRDAEYFSLFNLNEKSLEIIRLDSNSHVLIHKSLGI